MNGGAVVSTVLEFVGIVLIGGILRWTGALKPSDARPLNVVIIYVALPAFVFQAIQGPELRGDLWRVVATAWAVFAIMATLAWLATKLLKLPRKRAGAFILATALGNTGYIGYPLTAALLGKDYLPEAVFYDVFGTVVALVLVGFVIAEEYGREEAAKQRMNPLRELLTFPAVIALAVGLLARGIEIPIPVSNGLELLGNMVAPLVMLSVGLSLSAKTFKGSAVPLSLLLGLRLIVAPILALAIGSVLIGSGGPLRVAVLEAGAPAMMLTLVVGERFGLDTDFIASAILVTTACAAITMPLMQLLVG
ncbi:MAG: AEC family transporter [Coriobacteriia bacterium]